MLQFKNYVQSRFSFCGRIIGIYGDNGRGKTNLLDAIHYLCFTKSYFGKTDAQHVYNGAQGFRIEGQVEFKPPGETVTATCILRETGRKEFLFDGIAYEKFADHIGRFPCVFIAPDDVQLITGASEERRRFIDALLCQVNAGYLQHLMSYNKVLQQRNSYLKSLEGRPVDNGLLDAYDAQLTDHGSYVYDLRRNMLNELSPLVLALYNEVAGTTEPVGISYESALQQTSWRNLLSQSRAKDVLLQRTTQGIHRDDLNLLLDGQAFKNIASQGQRKSLLFALKLAEFELLKSNKGFAPLLLLDDVFEKLDARRMHNLLHRVCVLNEGQVFITDTHQERLRAAIEQLHVDFELIAL